MSRGSNNAYESKSSTSDVPAWVRDNLVLKLLDDKGMRLEVMYDRKYLNGLCNKPLIVIKGNARRRNMF